MFPRKLQMYGEDIDYVTQIKQLGVIIDSKLSWLPHLLEKIKKGRKLLHHFHNAQGKIWGVPPRMALWAYTGIVRPAFAHGCMVWAKVARKKTHQKKMESFQLFGLIE